MSDLMTVQTGSRLHLGLFATQSETGRSFGGLGLMIESPGCRLSVLRADRDQFDATPHLAARLSEWLAAYRTYCPSEWRPPPCRVSVFEEIPLHAGFGAGTQTALALAASLSRLAHEPNVTAVELARRVGRGKRSAIGLHGFELGGFLAEAGKQDLDGISPLLARVDFPTVWRLLLITPTDGCGLSGDLERTAFSQLGRMPDATTQRLHHIAEVELLPAVAREDFEAVAAGLSAFGRLNGEYFAPIQGGVFADSRMAGLAEWLAAAGWIGVGQSSWGPTLFVLCRDHSEAESLRQRVLDRMPHNVQIRITSARNHGAHISRG